MITELEPEIARIRFEMQRGQNERNSSLKAANEKPE